MTELLRTNSLSIVVHSGPLITDLSFSLHEGERIALVGPNGAGKSVLLKTLAGVTAKRSTVSILQKPASEYSATGLAKMIGYVPQRFSPTGFFSVRDFLSICARSVGIEEATPFPSSVTLLLERSLSNLSGGELQRALIAGALLHQPRVLLLDEPTTYLDPSAEYGVYDLLTSLPGECGVLAATHNLFALSGWATKVLALKGGKAFFFGSVAEFLSPALLSNLYGVSPDHLAFQTWRGR